MLEWPGTTTDPGRSQIRLSVVHACVFECARRGRGALLFSLAPTDFSFEMDLA